jgi:hypothetical protein
MVVIGVITAALTVAGIYFLAGKLTPSGEEGARRKVVFFNLVGIGLKILLQSP